VVRSSPLAPRGVVARSAGETGSIVGRFVSAGRSTAGDPPWVYQGSAVRPRAPEPFGSALPPAGLAV